MMQVFEKNALAIPSQRMRYEMNLSRAMGVENALLGDIPTVDLQMRLDATLDVLADVQGMSVYVIFELWLRGELYEPGTQERVTPERYVRAAQSEMVRQGREGGIAPSMIEAARIATFIGGWLLEKGALSVAVDADGNDVYYTAQDLLYAVYVAPTPLKIRSNLQKILPLFNPERTEWMGRAITDTERAEGLRVAITSPVARMDAWIEGLSLGVTEFDAEPYDEAEETAAAAAFLGAALGENVSPNDVPEGKISIELPSQYRVVYQQETPNIELKTGEAAIVIPQHLVGALEAFLRSRF